MSTTLSRDEFAAAAMSGLIGAVGKNVTVSDIAVQAFDMAEAMEAERLRRDGLAADAVVVATEAARRHKKELDKGGVF
jgi:hypothetical protein